MQPFGHIDLQPFSVDAQSADKDGCFDMPAMRANFSPYFPMRSALLTLVCMVCLAAVAQTPTNSTSTFGPQWRLLVGEWTSEASPATGPGTCAFQFSLGGHILIRTNHAEALPSGGRSGGTHEDLMVIYPGANEAPARATYWDNEGHVVEYSATWSADGNALTFLSKPGAGPQFRLTYRQLDADRLSVSFDLAPPGQPGAFKTYTSGRIRRQK